MNYYGIATKKEISLFVGEVCELFNGEMIKNDYYNQKYINAYNLVMETICAETLMGEMPDTDNKQGMGLTQFDKIRFNDTIEHSQKYQKKIWDKWLIDINLITYEALRYDWKSAIILTRLAYKRIEAPIPSTCEGRAEYWKKYWNTVKGAGKPGQYIERSKKYLNSCKSTI